MSPPAQPDIDQVGKKDSRRNRMTAAAQGLAPSRENFARVTRDEISMGWVYLLATVMLLGLFTYQAYLFFKWGEGSGLGLRYILMPAVFALLALWVGARYVQDIYELPGNWQSLQHLIAARFGVLFPSLEIREGKRSQVKDELNLLTEIGGPGNLIVRPGNAVVIESSYHPIRVIGPGRYYVRQFESVKEAISLGEQEDFISSLQVLSGDGIELSIKEVRFRYRAPRPGGAGQSPEAGAIPGGLDPTQKKATINRVYNRPVDEHGVAPWTLHVCQIVEQTLREYCAMQLADDLIVPVAAHIDPYKIVKDSFRSTEIQNRFAAIGSELQWVTIGSIAPPLVQNKPAPKKDASPVQPSGNVQADRTFNDRQREVYQQIGRAEALAETLIRVVHGLDFVQLNDQDPIVVQQALLAHVRQAVQAKQNP